MIKTIRWSLGLLSILLLTHGLFTSYMYSFEWLISQTHNFNWFIYSIVWFFLGFLLWLVLGVIFAIFSSIILFNLMQKNIAFSKIFKVWFFVLIIFWIYGALPNDTIYSWEALYKHRLFNRIVFILSMLGYIKLIQTVIEYVNNKKKV